MRLELPAGKAFVTIALLYSTLDSLPLVTGAVAAPLPTFDIPVLDQHWVAWTPPGYALLESDTPWQGDSAPSLTWSQRLFGPLGRSEREGWFDPLATDSWRGWVDRLEPVATRSAATGRLSTAIAALGAIAAEAREPITWRQLLARWKAAEPGSGWTLLVDEPSMALLGVSPDDAVSTGAASARPAGSEVRELARGRALLEAANLMLLVHDDQLLLTTTAGAARRREQWRFLEGLADAGVASGSLADEMNAAAAGRSRRFISLDAWSLIAKLDRTPWAVPSALREDLTGSRGWNAWSVQWSRHQTPGVRLVRTAAMQLCGWTLCVLILAGGAMLRLERAAPWMVMAGLIAALAMIVPAAWTLILAPSLLAVLAYLALLFTGRLALLLAPAGSIGAVAEDLRPQWIAGAALVLAAGIWGARAWAAENANPRGDAAARGEPASGGESSKNTGESAKPASRATPTYTVFVPVDDSGQLASGKYYSIPERLYAEMYAAADAASNRPGAWLLAGADYRGVLARDAAQRRVALNELKGLFDLHVFEPNATIRLTIDRESAAFGEGGVRVDGEPTPVEWDAAHGALCFQITDPGQYRVEINLLPSVARAGGVELAIPPLALAEFELTAPVDAPTIEVSSARGEVTFSREQGMMSGHLGPTARFAARWQEATGADGAANNVEAEELCWLHVRPGALTLDVRLRLRVNEGRVRQVRLMADPRLRLLPGSAESPIVAESHVLPGDPQVIDLELARPLADGATIDLRFVLAGASGIGNIRLPRLEVSDARTTRRWMAVSIDPSLVCEEQPAAEAKPLAVPDFATAWGPSDSRPSAAYSLPRSEAPLMLSTRPRELRPLVEQTLSLGIAQGRITALLEVSSQSLTASSFQLSLEGPRGLRVERVALFEDGLQRVARWSQDGSGRITIFLNSQLSARSNWSCGARCRRRPME